MTPLDIERRAARTWVARASESAGDEAVRLAAAIDRGRVTPTADVDACAFVAACALGGPLHGDALAAACDWLDAMRTTPRFVDAVWQDHRGAALRALDCASANVAAWTGPEACAAREALLALAVAEADRAVPDGPGMSFLVFEGCVEAFCADLAACPPDTRVPRFAAVAEWARSAPGQDWAAQRAWASTLATRTFHFPGEPSKLRPRTIRVADEDAVPFASLLPPARSPLVDALVRRFVAAAGRDVRIYDAAPLTVAALATLLPLADLTAVSPSLPLDFDAAVAALVPQLPDDGPGEIE